jgi:hypothetical protein
MKDSSERHATNCTLQLDRETFTPRSTALTHPASALARARYSQELRDGRAPLLKKFIAGGTSGAIGAGLANPADLVKVRMQCATGER